MAKSREAASTGSHTAHTSVWRPEYRSTVTHCTLWVRCRSSECPPGRWWAFQYSLHHVARSHTPLCLINSGENSHCILLVLNLFSTNFIWCCLILVGFFCNEKGWGVISCSLYSYLYFIFFPLVLPILEQKNCCSFKYSLCEIVPKPLSPCISSWSLSISTLWFSTQKTDKRITDMNPTRSCPVHNVVVSSILQSL